MSTKARAWKTPAPATLLVPGFLAEQDQGAIPIIGSQAIRHPADLLPGLWDLTGFHRFPLRTRHTGSLRGLLDGTASFFSSIAEKAAEQLAPGLAAEGGGTAGPGRRPNANDSYTHYS